MNIKDFGEFKLAILGLAGTVAGGIYSVYQGKQSEIHI